MSDATASGCTSPDRKKRQPNVTKAQVVGLSEAFWQDAGR
jgi:hypothetical protein